MPILKTQNGQIPYDVSVSAYTVPLVISDISMTSGASSRRMLSTIALNPFGGNTI
jgi:hypothetical protein